ncbi:hypothetical protein EsDP_00007058 [Epichloe bromicola]|uniref:N-acetyltransferase domain-containing protein n=1 Tax=Epichloe bromicola TaxID=79588 RepID=A0ABQ0CZG6_9HYPO
MTSAQLVLIRSFHLLTNLEPRLRPKAFFTCLRANLVLSPSALASNDNTPRLEPHSAQPAQTQPSSPCSSAIVSESLVPLDDIPPLSLDALTSQHDRTEGLRLVADSVSEMGPRAARAVFSHPLCLANLVSSWAAVYRLAYANGTERDASRALLLASGLAMLYFAAIRFLTSHYSTLADKIDRDWLRADGRGGEQQHDVVDVVLGAKAGQVLVGALVLRLEPRRAPTASPSKRRNRSRSASLKGGMGVIRAWTTTASHRGRGIGKELLDEAVRYTKDKCGKDARVGFAQEHANSVMVLPRLFNKGFRSNEIRAAKALNGSVDEWDSNNRKKR